MWWEPLWSPPCLPMHHKDKQSGLIGLEELHQGEKTSWQQRQGIAGYQIVGKSNMTHLQCTFSHCIQSGMIMGQCGWNNTRLTSIQEVWRMADLLLDSHQIDRACCPFGNAKHPQWTILLGQDSWLGHLACCQYTINALYSRSAITLAVLSHRGRNA